MEKLLRALILVPVITAFMQGVKQVLPVSMVKFMWILTCIISIALAYGFVMAMQITDMNNTMIIFGGIIAGLSASGLYEAGKNTVNTIKQG